MFKYCLLCPLIYASPRSFKMTNLSLRSASFTSCSSRRLNAARTCAVFAPLGMNTVPGKARTPPSSALVAIRSDVSASTSGSSLSSSLNLHPSDRPVPSAKRGYPAPMRPNIPKEHSRLGRRPFCQALELLPHRSLEHVTLLLVEIGHGLSVRLESEWAPRI